MATKRNVEIDENLVRQMISGQSPLTTNIIRDTAEEPSASVVVSPEQNSQSPDSPPHDECAATLISEPRRRRTTVLPDYEKTFLAPVNYDTRSPLYVSTAMKRKILEVVKKIGGERLTAISYVDNILRHHLETFRDEINRLHQERNFHDIL